MKLDGFGMDTMSLAGSLEAKLSTIRKAGFSQVMLRSQDVADQPGGIDHAVQALRDSGIRPIGFQVLRDFEGLTGPLHAFEVGVAQAMIETCAVLGGKVLVACSSTSVDANDSREAIVRDLRKLAMLAVPHGIKVAYQALAWGRVVDGFWKAWELVDEANCPNLGLSLDSIHMIISDPTFADLDLVDPLKIFIVQLADFLCQDARTMEEQIHAAHRSGVFPGEGVHTERAGTLVTQLEKLGYRGDYCFAVLNDDYRQLPRDMVARRAARSATWLSEDILRRMMPSPGRVARSSS